MLAFYVDDSADAARRDVFVLAGLLGDSEVWFDAERLWNQRLDEDGLSYFRATEYNSLTGEFAKLVRRYGPTEARMIADTLVADLKDIVTSRSLHAFCFLAPFQIYAKVQQSPYGGFVLNKDPYEEAHRNMIFQVSKTMAVHGLREPIAFVIDEHSKASAFTADWGTFKENHPKCAPYMGSIGAMDDKDCAALQMADLCANTTKRAFEGNMDSLNKGLLLLKEQWIEKNLAWIGYWTETYLNSLVDSAIDCATSPVPIPSRPLEDL